MGKVRGIMVINECGSAYSPKEVAKATSTIVEKKFDKQEMRRYAM
jgi:hypothetical protein